MLALVWCLGKKKNCQEVFHIGIPQTGIHRASIHIVVKGLSLFGTFLVTIFKISYSFRKHSVRQSVF